jgi:hypothetical protein
MIARAAAFVLLVAAVAIPGGAARPSASAYIYLKTSGYYGAVELAPSGTQIGACTTYCTFAFTPGTNVTLTAEPGAGRFAGWSAWATNLGSMCSGASPSCNVTLTTSTAVKANFTPVSLRITWTDGGYVTVGDSVPRCGSSCYLYELGARAHVRAQSVGDNAFSGWSGGCANIGAACGVNMNDNRVLGASFRCTGTICSITEPLSTKLNFWVKVIGGSVSGSLNCSGSCYMSVGVGQQLSLQASSSQVEWLSRVFRCRAGSTRCTFRVGTNSTSYSPLLIVKYA